MMLMMHKSNRGTSFVIDRESAWFDLYIIDYCIIRLDFFCRVLERMALSSQNWSNFICQKVLLIPIWICRMEIIYQIQMKIFSMMDLIVCTRFMRNHLSLLFFIDLSEETIDDRAINSQQTSGNVYLRNISLSFALIIDPLINVHIVNVEEDTPTFYCIFVLLLFSPVLYCCWPLLLYAFVAYRLITCDDSADDNSSVYRPSWPQSCNILLHLVSP